METTAIIGVLGLIRVMTLSVERVSLHMLGKSRYGAMAVMGVGFGGAAFVLWVMALIRGGHVWVESATWTGALYALAFGLYTAAFAKGPVSVVSPWTNATVVILWILHPQPSIPSLSGLVLFGAGAILLMQRKISYPVVFMLISDILLATARLIDVHHAAEAPIAYSASIFTALSCWMLAPIILLGKLGSLFQLIYRQPGWSFIAASSNAAAYLALFCLLEWLHPAAVEAISALASSLAVLAGVIFLNEKQASRKITASLLMTGGTILLLLD